MYEFERQVCGAQGGGDDEHRELRYWLTNTCEAARQGAYGGTGQSAGLASIALLRRSVEEDLRQWPGKLAFIVTARSAPAHFRPAAPATRQLVDAMLQGTHPVRALEEFSSQLLKLQASQGLAEASYKGAACLSAMPASVARAGWSVGNTTQGLDMNERQKGLATLLIALESPACAWVYAQLSPGHRFTQWMQSKDDLLVASEGVGRAAREFAEFARSGSELQEQLVALRQSKEGEVPEVAQFAAVAAFFSRQGLSALDAVSAVAEALGQLKALPPASTAALKEMDGALRSSTNMMDMLMAVVARDFSSAYQALLKHQASYVGPGTAPRCDAESATTHDRAMLLSPQEAGKRPWRCSVAPCMCAPPTLLKYGSLLVALADARNAEQVKDVVLAAAMPVGSWRLKQEPGRSRSMLTLGGQVGFGAALPLGGLQSSLYPRLLVPFGVDIALGNESNMGFFIQALDLAGYTNFSALGNGRTSPRVLEAISPGVAFRMFLFPRTPVVLTAGVAYDLDAGGLEPGGAARLHMGLAMDVTLFVLSSD